MQVEGFLGARSRIGGGGGGDSRSVAVIGGEGKRVHVDAWTPGVSTLVYGQGPLFPLFRGEGAGFHFHIIHLCNSPRSLRSVPSRVNPDPLGDPGCTYFRQLLRVCVCQLIGHGYADLDCSVIPRLINVLFFLSSWGFA